MPSRFFPLVYYRYARTPHPFAFLPGLHEGGSLDLRSFLPPPLGYVLALLFSVSSDTPLDVATPYPTHLRCLPPPDLGDPPFRLFDFFRRG